jgi:hypothetical protein
LANGITISGTCGPQGGVFLYLDVNGNDGNRLQTSGSQNEDGKQTGAFNNGITEDVVTATFSIAFDGVARVNLSNPVLIDAVGILTEPDDLCHFQGMVIPSS